LEWIGLVFFGGVELSVQRAVGLSEISTINIYIKIRRRMLLINTARCSASRLSLTFEL